MENTVNKRIKNFIDSIGKSISQTAREIGVSQPTLKAVVDGGNKPSFDTIEKMITTYPDLSTVWLMTGEGDMLNTKNHEILGEETFGMVRKLELAIAEDKYNKETRPRIPYAAAAGSLTTGMDGITADQCEQIPVIKLFPSYDFTIYIKGDSMFPRYESGDEVACKRIDDSRFIQWGKVHVMDTAQGIIIKRIYDAGEGIRCNSFNPDYPDFTIPKEEIYSMSLVVGLVRL